jgi:hypothetical protein
LCPCRGDSGAGVDGGGVGGGKLFRNKSQRSGEIFWVEGYDMSKWQRVYAYHRSH